MHLKSLTLKGFKSFANPTTLEFEPGVTCVVGPNGSGKSNVVDALAWVMGEQGAKSLRGGKMEDVIFAGTATRGPLGRAEVTLTIDNADGALPIDYAEVTIRRTMFRSGGSEYAINGEQVRLLDVQELLSDSGLGREMHVIVGQGRLDSVLHASPEDRRGFVEEAAGILKHRRRKERTVRKLEAMEQNLQRLRDLVGEVRRQLKPLGRQAEVARRAQGIAAIVRDAKARIMADDAVTLREQLRAAASTEQERATERLVLKEKLDRALLRIDRLQHSQRGDEVDRARRIAFDLESVRERVRNLQLLAGQRESMLRTRLDEPALQVTVAPADVDAARTEVDELQLRAAEAETAWHESQRATVAARAELDDLDREIAAQSALLSKHDLARSELQGRVDAAAQRLAAVRGEVLRDEHARTAAAERLATAEGELDEVESSTEEGEADSSGLDDAYAAAQQDVVDAQAAVDELRDAVHELERERDALDARGQALALAAEVHDGAVELLATRPAGVVGRVSDRLRVVRGDETAITAALGAFADAILAESGPAALALGAAAAGHGRVHLVAELAGAGAVDGAGAAGAGAAGGGGDAGDAGDAFEVDPARPADAVGSGRASAVDDERFADAVAALAAEHGLALAPAVDSVSGVPVVARALRRTLLVDELPDAAVTAELLARLPFGARIVSRRGDVLDATSLTAAGNGEGEEPGASRLELVAERDRAAADLERVGRELDARALELAEHRGALQVAKDAAASALADLRGFDAELAKRREALNRARARVESARAELGRAEKSHELAARNVGEAEERAAKAKHELEVHEATPRPIFDGSKRGEYAAAVERARDAEVEARLGLETLRERLRAEQLRIDELVRKRDAEREAADRAARETVLRREELARTERVLAAIPGLLDSLDRSVDEARRELAAAERRREEEDRELRELRETEGGLRRRLAEIGEDVHALEMQIYEHKLQLSNLLERAASELSLSEPVLIAEYGPDVPVPLEVSVEGAGAAASPGTAAGTGDSTPARVGAAAPTSARAGAAAPTPARAGAVEPTPARAGAAEPTPARAGAVEPDPAPGESGPRSPGGAELGGESGPGSLGGAEFGGEPGPGSSGGAEFGGESGPGSLGGAEFGGESGTGSLQRRVEHDTTVNPRQGEPGPHSPAPADHAGERGPHSARAGTLIGEPGPGSPGAGASIGERGPDSPGAGAPAGESGPDSPGPRAADRPGDPEPPIATEPYDRERQRKRLARAEREMAQLGRINPLALEEFAALEQRHAYLDEQLDDLVRTRADLLKIVADIDTRMQEVFAAAFDDTRRAFHEVFPMLFPGGAGDLSLTDPDDLLTTGIDIAVRPAGKKIDKLSLLSGGERSLAAVALLVAIFKARPSPFYIMDEVEAALDDANLGRLLDVFEDLRATSQLIVITHQKRTMEIADALYGVSMHRDGISTVVGQRIRELAPVGDGDD